MPEYLAPGVYVEETSFRSKSIEGVSTTTTGFVGPARFGPTDLGAEVITSLAEFERVYGDGQVLKFTGGIELPNYLWHAARGFFEEGGKRLYIARIFRPAIDTDGRASKRLPKNDTAEEHALIIHARHPGAAGNGRVQFALHFGRNILGPIVHNGSRTVGALADKDLVWIRRGTGAPPLPADDGVGQFYTAQIHAQTGGYQFTTDTPGEPLTVANLDKANDQLCVVTLSVTFRQQDGSETVWDSIALEPGHATAGAADALEDRFPEQTENLALVRSVPLVITLGDKIEHGYDVVKALFSNDTALQSNQNIPYPKKPYLSSEFALEGGNDGARPGPGEYTGTKRGNRKTGLQALEDVEDISIIAAPGSTHGLNNGYADEGLAVAGALLSHAEHMRYRIAVIDSGNGQSLNQVREWRARLDSKYAALYYPWICVFDPITRQPIHLPPSGFVAGLYARNDIQGAVYKAPANVGVNSAIGLESILTQGQQDVLNPEGINCFRYFEGRGFRLWGARTISSDPEWKYVNLRRYFAYLERSIDKGTRWAVFEPNGEALWANVRRTIEDFLLHEWRKGGLLGDKPEKACFVKCDRSTMTQNDLENGRLVCLVGVAPIRPAEFVIFRIGQWTADRKS